MKTYFLKTILFMATLFVACSTFADDKVTVAVFNFGVTSTANRVRQLGPKITSLVTAELSASDQITLVERAQLSKALKEQALGLSGGVDADAAAKVGHLTGAKVLVAGHGFKPGGGDKFVVTVNIIGTENGRLFVEKVEGTTEKAAQIANEITQRILKVITEQRTNLIVPAAPTQNSIDEIVKLAKGSRRPSVLIKVLDSKRHVTAAEYELGMIFHRAGFNVISESSDEKADVTITGNASSSHVPGQKGFSSCRVVLASETIETASGKVLNVDQQRTTAIDADKISSQKAAYANAADLLAMKLLPILSEERPQEQK
jgi:TolB-like protein